MDYLEKFTVIFPRLVQDMKACEHNSKYHLEGSVWTHTCMVYSYVKGAFPNNKVLLLSAILHDIGKVFTKTVDSNGVTRYPKHEAFSTLYARSILNKFDCTDKEIIDILNIISLHGVNSEQLQDIPYLKMFKKADNMGRINANMTLREYEKRKFCTVTKNPRHTVTLLCGLPGSGKTTLLKSECKEFSNNINIISKEDFIIQNYGDIGEDYYQIEKEVYADPLVFKNFTKDFSKLINKASQSDEDYIIDMHMLSLQDRRSMMNSFPNAKFKCIVFIPPIEIVVSRLLKKDMNKMIGFKQFNEMTSKFVMPTKAEGFEEIIYKI